MKYRMGNNNEVKILPQTSRNKFGIGSNGASRRVLPSLRGSPKQSLLLGKIASFLAMTRLRHLKSFSGLGLRLLSFLFVLSSFTAHAEKSKMQGIPVRPSPQRLVNNMCGFNGISPEQENALETKLVGFANATSNQMVIVILPFDSLHDNDPSEFATEIGENWQVGQKKFDNGIVILLIPDKHKVFIATGYGLEGAIPDATCEDIVQREMIPNFKKGDYYTGLNSAVDVLIGLAKGEYNSGEYAKKDGQKSKAIGLIFALLVFLVIFILNRRGGGKGGMTIGGPGIFFWGGGFGGGGGGSSFGGGGGFGGFGGGGFGGGGAGGSW